MPNAGTWDQLLGVTQAKLSGQAPVERRRLPIAQLAPNADQPRKFFDAQALGELASSISAHGILQPILVRPHPQDPGRHQIVAGERRWLAAQQAGLAEVPVVVRELDDQQALELGLVENVLREDITPMEEARALKRLIDAFGYSYARLGDRLGKNKAYVDHRVRLLKMPQDIQEALERAVAEGEDGKVRRPFSPRHAGIAVQVADDAARRQLIEAVFSEGLSVAQMAGRLRDSVAAPAPAQAHPVTHAVTRQDAAPAVAAASSEPLSSARHEPASAGQAATSHDVVSPDVDCELDIKHLALYKLLTRAQRGSGQVSAKQALAAMQRDRKMLLALLQAASHEALGG